MSFLKNHPFAVEAFFESSLVLAFAVPKEELASRIPPCLELDTFNDQWAFVAAAMVQTKGLRPKGFPAFLGNDFFLIGYRIFVRYTTSAGKRLRGLYIIGSQTDKRKMEIMGNIFTHYNYTTTDITHRETDNRIEVSSVQAKLHVSVETGGENVALPAGSPFADWKEARRFAGPLPFTFTYNAPKREVLIIEGVRQNWQPSPVKVLDYQVGFLEKLQLKEARLASAFLVSRVPYHWKKGRVERWKAG